MEILFRFKMEFIRDRSLKTGTLKSVQEKYKQLSEKINISPTVTLENNNSYKGLIEEFLAENSTSSSTKGEVKIFLIRQTGTSQKFSLLKKIVPLKVAFSCRPRH